MARTHSLQRTPAFSTRPRSVRQTKGSDWFGSPAPQRGTSDTDVVAHLTFCPTPCLYALSYPWVACTRVNLPHPLNEEHVLRRKIHLEGVAALITSCIDLYAALRTFDSCDLLRYSITFLTNMPERRPQLNSYLKPGGEIITFTEETLWRMLHMMQCDNASVLHDYIVERVSDVVVFAISPGTPRPNSLNQVLALGRRNLLNTIKNTFRWSEVRWPVIVVSLIYVERARDRFEVTNPASAFTTLYIGALILANKYCNDASIRNVDWARCSGMKPHEVNQIEVDFLATIDYRLRLVPDDLSTMMYHMVAVCFPPVYASAPSYRARYTYSL